MNGFDHIFSRRFWRGEADGRVLASFRIALGLVLLFDLVDRARDLNAFFSDRGIWPRAEAFQPWWREAHWSIFSFFGSPLPIAVLFALGFPIAIAFLVGYRTRLATVLAFVFWQSLQMRNLLVSDGGDVVVRVMLFWGMWIDLGAAWSIDQFRRAGPSARVPAFVLRLMQLQVALIYAVSFAAKTGATWRKGDAVRLALLSFEFARPAGRWLARLPLACHVLTWSTLAVEAAFPVLVFASRRTRRWILCFGLALHLGILLTMRVGLFSLVMPATYLLFLAPDGSDRAEPAPLPTALRRAARLQTILAGALAAQLGVAAVSQVLLVRTGRVPAVLQRELLVVGLWQDWRMFAPNPPDTNYRWDAPGVLTDGARIDVLAEAAPRLAPGQGFFYSRWYKYRSDLNPPGNDFLRLGRYLCRRYNSNAPPGAKLLHFVLKLTPERIPLRPGSPMPSSPSFVALRQSCGR